MTIHPPLPFTLRQLQYAAAVEATRHFQRAAESCAVAQPSLSAQLAALEEALGLPLFERDRRGVLPTPAGTLLMPRIEALLRDAQELLLAARQLKDPLKGPLRLGIIPTLAPYLLPSLGRELQAAFPDLLPLWREDTTGNLVAALEAGQLDAAFLALEAPLGDLASLPLGQDPFLLCLPQDHPLAQGEAPLSLASLGQERLLLLEEGHCLRDQALAACRTSRLEEKGYRATSLPTLVQVVAAGAGLTLLPALSAATETRRAPVRLRPLADPAPFRTIALSWRKGSALAGSLKALEPAARKAFQSALA